MNTFGCMKIPEYIQTYEELFAPLKNKPVKILELGVLSGASLLMWAEYFRDGEIVGLDMNPPIDWKKSFNLDGAPRVFQYQGQQDDYQLLQEIVDKHGPFDIIIDDASHRRGPTQNSYFFLKDYLKSGGFYVIEDWGTGYWDSSRGFDGVQYLPGNRHYAGMVGLIKDLVDEVAINDLPEPFNRRPVEWKSMEVRWGQAILRKL